MKNLSLRKPPLPPMGEIHPLKRAPEGGLLRPPFGPALGLCLLPTPPLLKTALFGSILALVSDHANPDSPGKVLPWGPSVLWIRQNNVGF